MAIDKKIPKHNGPWFNDLNLPAANLRPGATPPDFANVLASGGIFAFVFDGTNRVEEVHGATEVLHGYKEGTSIDFHVHWMPTDGASGNVLWGIEYAWANVDGNFGAPVIQQIAVPATGTAWDHIMTDITEVSGAGPKLIASQLLFRLFRDATDPLDTYNGSDAALIAVGVHYQVVEFGSRQELIK